MHSDGTHVPPIDLAIVTDVDPRTAWAAVTLPEQVAPWLMDASALDGPGPAYRLDVADGGIVVGEVVELVTAPGSEARWEPDGATSRADHEASLAGYLDVLRPTLGDV